MNLAPVRNATRGGFFLETPMKNMLTMAEMADHISAEIARHGSAYQFYKNTGAPPGEARPAHRARPGLSQSRAVRKDREMKITYWDMDSRTRDIIDEGTAAVRDVLTRNQIRPGTKDSAEQLADAICTYIFASKAEKK